MTDFQDIYNCIQTGSIRQTADLITQALKENLPAADILKEGLSAGMMEMERRFRKNEILDSELLAAEQAMRAGLEILMPSIESRQTAPVGTVITGTLKGDIRENEKDIMSFMMQSLGLRVIDLGTSVSSARFVEAAIKEQAHLIVCGTALTIFLPQMKALVQAASQANIRTRTKILFTGGPVTAWFCKSIEADMYAPNAVRAAEIAAEHCKKLRLAR